MAKEERTIVRAFGNLTGSIPALLKLLYIGDYYWPCPGGRLAVISSADANAWPDRIGTHLMVIDGVQQYLGTRGKREKVK